MNMSQPLGAHSERNDLSRNERDRISRRREILDAARNVFALHGFEKATLCDVAKRAEYGTGTIYNYFPNKERLFESVIEDAFGELKQIADEALSASLPFEGRIRLLIDRELRYFFDKPANLRLLLRESYQLRDQNPIVHLMPTLLATIVAAISEGQRSGEVVADCEPDDLGTALLNLLFGQFVHRIYKQMGWPKSPDSRDQIYVLSTAEPLPPDVVEREIARMSRVILTVFLSGVER